MEVKNTDIKAIQVVIVYHPGTTKKVYIRTDVNGPSIQNRDEADYGLLVEVFQKIIDYVGTPPIPLSPIPFVLDENGYLINSTPPIPIPTAIEDSIPAEVSTIESTDVIATPPDPKPPAMKDANPEEDGTIKSTDVKILWTIDGGFSIYANNGEYQGTADPGLLKVVRDRILDCEKTGGKTVRLNVAGKTIVKPPDNTRL